MNRKKGVPQNGGASEIQAQGQVHHLPRFLVAPDAFGGERVQLDPAEAKHVRVRRLPVGSTVILFDGAGQSCEARVERVSRQVVEVTPVRRLPDYQGESDLDLTLAVALLKADRLEWVIEKATELGVNRVFPFACRHSLGRGSARRGSRWQQIAAAAAKQCGRSVVPAIEEPVDFTALLRERTPSRFLLWESAGPGETVDLAHVPSKPARAVIVIGPEGGFAPTEAQEARASGFCLVGLGPRILRADTAAIAAVALCQHRWGDLHGRRPDRAPIPNPEP